MTPHSGAGVYERNIDNELIDTSSGVRSHTAARITPNLVATQPLPTSQYWTIER
jgi:hypothetical protein